MSERLKTASPAEIADLLEHGGVSIDEVTALCARSIELLREYAAVQAEPHPAEVEAGQRGIDALKAQFATQAMQDTQRIDHLEQWRQEGNKAEPHVQFDTFAFELWTPIREQLDRMIELRRRHDEDD